MGRVRGAWQVITCCSCRYPGPSAITPAQEKIGQQEEGAGLLQEGEGDLGREEAHPLLVRRLPVADHRAAAAAERPPPQLAMLATLWPLWLPLLCLPSPLSRLVIHIQYCNCSAEMRRNHFRNYPCRQPSSSHSHPGGSAAVRWFYTICSTSSSARLPTSHLSPPL